MKDVTDDAISKAWRDHFRTRDTRSVRREAATKLKGVLDDAVAGQIVWDIHLLHYHDNWVIYTSALSSIGQSFLMAAKGAA